MRVVIDMIQDWNPESIMEQTGRIYREKTCFEGFSPLHFFPFFTSVEKEHSSIMLHPLEEREHLFRDNVSFNTTVFSNENGFYAEVSMHSCKNI